MVFLAVVALCSGLHAADVRVQNDAFIHANLGELVKGRRTALLVVQLVGASGPEWEKASQQVGADLKGALASQGLAVLKAPASAAATDAQALAALKDSGADVLVLAQVLVAPGSDEALVKLRVMDANGTELGRRVVDRAVLSSAPVTAAEPPAPTKTPEPAAASPVPAPSAPAAQTTATMPPPIPANVWTAAEGQPPVMPLLESHLGKSGHVGLAVLAPKDDVHEAWAPAWWQVRVMTQKAMEVGGLTVEAPLDVRTGKALAKVRGRRSPPLWVVARLGTDGSVTLEANRQGRALASRTLKGVLTKVPSTTVSPELWAQARPAWSRGEFRDGALSLRSGRIERVDGVSVAPSWLAGKVETDELDGAIATSARNTTINNVFALLQLANCGAISCLSLLVVGAALSGGGAAGSQDNGGAGGGLALAGCLLGSLMCGGGAVGSLVGFLVVGQVFPRDIPDKPLKRAVTTYNTSLAQELKLDPADLDPAYFPLRSRKD